LAGVDLGQAVQLLVGDLGFHDEYGPAIPVGDGFGQSRTVIAFNPDRSTSPQRPSSMKFPT
jgi:hypothetical protein